MAGVLKIYIRKTNELTHQKRHPEKRKPLTSVYQSREIAYIYKWQSRISRLIIPEGIDIYLQRYTYIQDSFLVSFLKITEIADQYCKSQQIPLVIRRQSLDNRANLRITNRIDNNPKLYCKRVNVLTNIIYWCT